MRTVVSYCLILLLGCSFPEPLPSDQTYWPYDLPSDHSMDEAALLVLNDSINHVKPDGSRKYEQINSLIILKDENIVFENYFFDNNGNFPRRGLTDLGRSTLLVSGLALGVMFEQRLLDSLQTPVYLLLPEYENFFDDFPQKKEITLEHLLIHTSGLSWNEALLWFYSESNDIILMENEADWLQYVVSKPLEAPPGLRYGYNSGSGLIISEIVESVTGSTLEQYAAEHIFGPLGITDWTWESDPQGTTNGATGLSLSLFDLTKIGSVYLNEGKWQGRFIIDPNFALDASENQNVFSTYFNFGYFWWKFADEYQPNQILPTNDAFYFPNENGDHIYIIPHQNMIITIGAENLFYGFWNPSLWLYFDILRTVQ